ncbi:alpha/beta hydrolase-fold protein [Vibrio sp. 99-70-13A1]|uniref:alpha/beta hydrolase-fold protein n=1 Tax=Vibrio sp. 99-70-13A1 TaxID=2607601 RepID=UPI00149398CE|nr:alpha/beta hydrolase-fold protein [Vibrio sp. 99-70-13A1]NOH95640.1 esterase family protein [Vibrio sp. 99-70-13A1]
MRLILLGMLWGAVMTGVSANTLELNKGQHYQVKSNETIKVHVGKPSYYRGGIKSTQVLNWAGVVDSNGEVIKTLINSPTKEAEIFWLINKPDDYEIQFVAQKTSTDLNTSGETNSSNAAGVIVNVLLKTISLKDTQYVSPEERLISPKIQETAHQIQQNLADAETKFWHDVNTNGGTPLVEYTENNTAIVTFLYKGPAENVRVLGSPYGGHAHLSQLGNSHIWFRSFEVPADTRLSYRIAPNVPQIIETKGREQRRAVLATAQPDPLNQQPIYGAADNLFGLASTVTLANAPSDSITKSMGKPEGEIFDHLYQSDNEELSRKITFYQPNETYQTAKDAPLLILFDGDAYLEKVPTPLILDNLIALKKVPPMRAIFVNTPAPSLRAKELTPNKAYAAFMANELMPWLCQRWGICPKAENTILSGSSFGGLASMYISFQHPERFGKVISQSGSFWWAPQSELALYKEHDNWVAELVRSQPKKDIDIYLTAGVFEVEPHPNSILTTNHQLYQTLKSKGYSVHLQEASSGHDYFNWQVMLAEGLTSLFANSNSNSNSNTNTNTNKG